MEVALRHPDLTSEDARRQFEEWYPGLKPRDQRVWGPVMKAAEKREMVEATTDQRTDNRVASHRRPKRIWRSLLYGR